MKNDIDSIYNHVIKGKKITRKQASFLVNAPLEQLCDAANKIRERFCANSFDVCSVFNGKCGKCSEDCKFCAQSSFYNTKIESFSMISDEQIPLNAAKFNRSKGILRLSIVTSGRGLTNIDTKIVCKNYRVIKQNCDIFLCASHGILSNQQLIELKNSGVERIHCNLEAGKKFFKNICTTHTYRDRIKTIKQAKKLGLSICSGGIFGVNESWSDRLDMAFALRKLGVESVPINALRAIEGTPLEHQTPLNAHELRRIIAIFRFVLPKAVIRMAAGRGMLADKGRAMFCGGANGCITGDMLTTSGVHVDEDKEILASLGFKIEKCN